MSPTVFRFRNYRFFFFSDEEERMHVHVRCPDGEAKFWLDPAVVLDDFVGLSARQVRVIQKVVMERRDEIVKAWKKHFGIR